MPMGKGTYGSKRGRPKKKMGPNMKGRTGMGMAALQKVARGAKKKADVKKTTAAKSRFDKIIYGNTRRKKK